MMDKLGVQHQESYGPSLFGNEWADAQGIGTEKRKEMVKAGTSKHVCNKRHSIIPWNNNNFYVKYSVYDNINVFNHGNLHCLFRKSIRD